MDIHELNELLGTNLISESVDTIGGFIIDLLGEVPEKDRTFEHQGLHFSILACRDIRTASYSARHLHQISVFVPMKVLHRATRIRTRRSPKTFSHTASMRVPPERFALMHKRSHLSRG